MPSARRKTSFARKNAFSYDWPAWVMKRRPPVMNITAKPGVDQLRISFMVFAAGPPRNARPSRRRSKIAIMPTDRGRARMWLPSINGNNHVDSAMANANGVCSSHWHQPNRDVANMTQPGAASDTRDRAPTGYHGGYHRYAALDPNSPERVGVGQRTSLVMPIPRAAVFSDLS